MIESEKESKLKILNLEDQDGGLLFPYRQNSKMSTIYKTTNKNSGKIKCQKEFIVWILKHLSSIESSRRITNNIK